MGLACSVSSVQDLHMQEQLAWDTRMHAWQALGLQLLLQGLKLLTVASMLPQQLRAVHGLRAVSGLASAEPYIIN